VTNRRGLVDGDSILNNSIDLTEKNKKRLPKLKINSESFVIGDSIISSRTSRKATDKVFVSNLSAVKQMSI
jgi:hypothetical protein